MTEVNVVKCLLSKCKLHCDWLTNNHQFLSLSLIYFIRAP